MLKILGSQNYRFRMYLLRSTGDSLVEVASHKAFVPRCCAWRICEDFSSWPVLVEKLWVDKRSGRVVAEVLYCGFTCSEIVGVSTLKDFTLDFARHVRIYELSGKKELPLFTQAMKSVIKTYAELTSTLLPSVYSKLNVPPEWRVD